MLLLGSLSSCQHQASEWLSSGERDGFQVVSWQGEERALAAGLTHFGFVHRGSMRLVTSAGAFDLRSGMYFSVPDGGRVEGDGQGLIVSQSYYRGFFQIGGPIEETGRLRYINGCSDSLLLAPVVKGDPCLNLLYVPAGVDQTPHTHPSERVGIVVRGKGVCGTPTGEVSLEPGLIFVIPADNLHNFQTREESLTIVAWHPDSDFGPSDQSHPMLNRTLVDGHPVNAKGCP